MAETNVQPGDQVSYPWSGGRPGGTVSDLAAHGPVTMETKSGNEVKKDGEPGNPALYIERSSGHDVVKKASEVAVEEKKEEEGKEKGDVHKESHVQPDQSNNTSSTTAAGLTQGFVNKESHIHPSTDSKKDDDEKKENSTASVGEKRKAEDDDDDDDSAEAEKKQKTTDGEEQPKKKGRPAKGTPSAGGKKESKKKAPKRAATESGEPRRSGRNASK